ncbi:hypothetical protein [Streptomyces sp. VRA16 Mangrove soil]|uniref:hypothetical protein n=1 Tax=Streptomyces sp. VRA16 Mangrove soil TaxID=2817434 RepID=UPI001A9FE947|nr:hypothetical protein [Streptomyces sp. VRA16 Mangrove soil]MBO1337624.1 hypothetical protein [Streptomyces sp. VRA16 Mangrove soil]
MSSDGRTDPDRNPKPWLRQHVRGTSPVHARDGAWIERQLKWCEREFGAATEDPALPGFVPRGFEATQRRTEELVRRVGAVMGADTDGLRVRLVEPEGAHGARRHIGEYREEPDGPVIDLDRSVAARPDTFAALIAHELAHARLARAAGLAALDLSPAQEERLTDLVTVHLGMGVLTANAADTYGRKGGYSVMPLGDLDDWMLTGRRDERNRIGYLSRAEFGYALVCWTLARGENHPAWAGQLVPSVRAAFTRGIEYRAARGD